MTYELTIVQALAATAVLASAINIGGGFTITSRMLNMFRRPTDPTEYNYLYAVPAAALVGSYAAGHLAGLLPIVAAILHVSWLSCTLHGIFCGTTVGSYAAGHLAGLLPVLAAILHAQ